MSAVFVILGVIGVSLLGRQAWELLMWVARLLLKVAVRLMPASERGRCDEEWSAELNHLPGAFPMLAWSLSYLAYATGQRVFGTLGGSVELPVAPSPILLPERAWPWGPIVASCAMDIIGNLEGAISLGIGRDRRDVEELSSLLAISSEGDPSCTVIWSQISDGECLVDIESANRVHRHRFIRCEDGSLEADFCLFHVREDSHMPGVGVRLMRNAMLVYDRLGVQHMVTYCGSLNGGIVWAKVGAAPINAEQCRAELHRILVAKVADGELNPDTASSIRSVIDEASDATLMHDVSRLFDHQGNALGQLLLRGLHWAAYFDLNNADQREKVKFALSQ